MYFCQWFPNEVFSQTQQCYTPRPPCAAGEANEANNLSGRHRFPSSQGGGQSALSRAKGCRLRFVRRHGRISLIWPPAGRSSAWSYAPFRRLYMCSHIFGMKRKQGEIGVKLVVYFNSGRRSSNIIISRFVWGSSTLFPYAYKAANKKITCIHFICM